MGIKENWEKVDEVCASCGQVTKRQRGITKQNMKRLFSFKFNSNEVVITIILLMVLLIAYAYKIETQQCRDWIVPIFKGEKTCDSICAEVREDMAKMNLSNQHKEIDLSNVTLTKPLTKP